MLQKLNKWDCIIDPIFKNNVQIGGLYLADIDCALSPELLKQLKIGALLSVIDEPKVSTTPDVIHQVINVPDCTELNLQEFFPKTNEFIERHRSHTNVMVHCFAGISRSATVVIAYIMQKFQWGFQRTLNSVIARRPQVKPNQGFIKQLISYETQNRQRASSQQNRIINTINNVIDKMPFKSDCKPTKYPLQPKQNFQSDCKPNKYFQPSKLDLGQLENEILKRQQDLQMLKERYQQLNDKIVNRNNVYVSAFE